MFSIPLFYGVVSILRNVIKDLYTLLLVTKLAAPTGDEVGITYYSKKTGEIVYDLDTISIEEGQDN